MFARHHRHCSHIFENIIDVEGASLNHLNVIVNIVLNFEIFNSVII